MKKLMLTTAIMMFASHVAQAADTELVNKWYGALKTSNRAVFQELIANDAVLEINPLEITQTKGEYIEALDNWEDVAEDLTLIMKGVNSRSETTAVAMVCYKFSQNSFLNEERFEFLDNKVIKYSQIRRQDEC